MKTLNTIKYPVILLFIITQFLSCKGILDDNIYGVDPETQTDMTNKALRVSKFAILKEGPMPASNNGGLSIVGYPKEVQVSAGVLLFFTYSTTNDSNLCTLYLQIEGADSYWEAPVEKDTSSGQPYIKVLIPNFVKQGNFNIIFSAGDCNGQISPIAMTNTEVAAPLTCPASFSGSVGITVLSVYLGNNPGIVNIYYEMYTVPDRLDVRYNDQWVTSTGPPQLAPNQFPNCSFYTGGPGNGYVQDDGVVSFSYNPKVSTHAEIYVSGCGSGTAWDISVDCPQ